jgi:hypothetical protein
MNEAVGGKSRVDSRGFPCPLLLEILKTGIVWDVMVTTGPNLYPAHSVQFHNREDNVSVFDDIQISSVCYHFTQYSKHY